MNTKSANSKYSQLVLLVKVLVLIVIGVLLFNKLEAEEEVIQRIGTVIANSIDQKWIMYLMVILMMPMNWFMEAIKWKFLVRKLDEISLSNAFKGVLSGLTLSFATPHGVGDYFGRILSIHKLGREGLVGSLFISRISQMLATALFGLIGLFYLFGFFWLMMGLGLIVILSLATYGILIWLNKHTKLNKYILLVNQYTKSELAQVQVLSIIRYLIFSIQFLLVIYIFIPNLDFLLTYGGVTFIFLAKSILPTFNFLSDLGIREYAAIEYFEKFNFDTIPIIAASLSLWVINILIPTIIGIPSMLKLKWNNT